MPHRRRMKKGSFSGHFDELVKHFGKERTDLRPPGKSAKLKRKPKMCVHQALFESATRK